LARGRWRGRAGLGVALGLLLAVLVGRAWLGPLPDPREALAQARRPPSVQVTDRAGRVLFTTLSQGQGYALPLPPERIPACLRAATLAVEDASFYTNPGVDWRGIVRAAWLNLRAGRVVAGGSTLTQQVARNLLLPPEERHQRTLRRKLRETWLAWRLTRVLSKDEILALYLNHTYYGGLAYGVEAAARTYFGKPASELTLAECALLAGLPQAPAAYDPFLHPDAARERQKVVLDLMVQQGFITPAQRERAWAEPLVLNPQPHPLQAPHAVWMALTWLAEQQAAGRVPSDRALEVRLTLDLDVQRRAEAAVQRHLARLQAQGKEVNNAAVVVVDARTGQVRALVGSADYLDPTIHGALNMAVQPRPTGSAFKPFIYALALEPDHPPGWTEATVLWDLETVFTTHDGRPYRPRNYDLREHGPVTLRQALASSLNIPAVQALDAVGVERTVARAHALGLSLGSPRRYDLSLALGGGEVSLLELTAAYTAFADQGRYHPPRLVLEVRDLATGQVRYRPPAPPPRAVWDPRVAWLISDILSDDTARALGFGRYSSLEVGFPAAVKTGTSSGFHDNWTIGYTPQVVVGVWVGHADYRPMQNVDGLTGAGPIWNEIIRALTPAPQPFPQPPGLVQKEVCTLSGQLPTPACPQTHTAWFLQGTEPTEPDTLFRAVVLDAATGLLAGPATPPERRRAAVALDLRDPRAQQWARAHGWPVWADLAAENPTEPAASDGLALLRPLDGAVYRLDPRLPAAAQRIQVEAAVSGPARQVRLGVDEQVLAVLTRPPYRASWALTPGRHRVWAEVQTASGARQRTAVWIQVLPPEQSEGE